MGLALSVQISALSWLLSTRYHLDIHQVGLVWAAGPIAGIVGQLLTGLLSDKTWFWGGRRRPFILLGGVTAALMLFCLPQLDAVAGVLGIQSVLAVAVCVALTLDLAINIGFAPSRALVADMTLDGDARTRGYTWMQSISGFWGVLAYVTGACWGNDVLIAGGMLVVLAFSVLPTLFIAEPKVLASPEVHWEAGPGLPQRRLFKVYLAHGCSWFGIQAMFVYMFAFVQQHIVIATDAAGIAARSGQVLAVAFAVLNTVGFVLPALLLQPLSKRFSRPAIHASCCMAMAAGFLMIALVARTPSMLYVAMAVVGVGWASVVSLPFAIMSEQVGKQRMGLFMGVFNLSVVLPQLLVSFPLGMLMQRVADKSVLFQISAAALLLSAALWSSIKDNGRA